MQESLPRANSARINRLCKQREATIISRIQKDFLIRGEVTDSKYTAAALAEGIQQDGGNTHL